MRHGQQREQKRGDITPLLLAYHSFVNCVQQTDVTISAVEHYVGGGVGTVLSKYKFKYKRKYKYKYIQVNAGAEYVGGVI